MSLNIFRILVLLEINALLLLNNIYNDTLEVLPRLSDINLTKLLHSIQKLTTFNINFYYLIVL